MEIKTLGYKPTATYDRLKHLRNISLQSNVVIWKKIKVFIPEI